MLFLPRPAMTLVNVSIVVRHSGSFTTMDDRMTCLGKKVVTAPDAVQP
jgi:hypothetical protein